MSINRWLGSAGVLVVTALFTAGASAQTPAVARESLVAQNAKLTAQLSLVESRRKALIKASASLGFLAGPVRALVSHVGRYEEQLYQQRVDNLVWLAQLRRTTGAGDVEQFVKRPDGERRETALVDRLRRLFVRS